MRCPTRAAVAKVRNPHHKYEEMIHSNKSINIISNFMSHKLWQQACPSRVQHFLVSPGNTFVVVLWVCSRSVFTVHFLNAAGFCICSISVFAAHFLNVACVVKLMKMFS